MAFDFKKEYKEYYLPKNNPQIVTIPKMNYISVQGFGNPNKEDGLYKHSIEILYSVAYTLKMSYKTDYKIEGFFEYVVPPLEGLWWLSDKGKQFFDGKDKEAFQWISLIRLPDFVTQKDFDWAVDSATKKKKGLDCSQAKFLTIDEGLCVQMMHIVDYDSEPQSISLMEDYINQNNYANDINENRHHHEIYLSDPRKVAADKCKTVIRIPIRNK